MEFKPNTSQIWHQAGTMSMYYVHILTCVLHTARISNIESVLNGDNWGSFKLSSKMKKLFIFFFSMVGKIY